MEAAFDLLQELRRGKGGEVVCPLGGSRGTTLVPGTSPTVALSVLHPQLLGDPRDNLCPPQTAAARVPRRGGALPQCSQGLSKARLTFCKGFWLEGASRSLEIKPGLNLDRSDGIRTDGAFDQAWHTIASIGS